MPFIEELHTYVWRRQLSAFLARKAAQFGATAGTQPDATVGFADISGFTALSRDAATSDLATLLELFESVASDETTCAAIASDGFRTHEQQPQDVRGYDRLRSWLVTTT